MSELVIFVGLPGAGKSTFYASHFAATHLQVSKDRMPNARDRERRQQKMIEQTLAGGRSVVVDNTNPSQAVRAPLIEIGRRLGARVIAYYFECSVALARARNRQREGQGPVPDVAIFVAAKKLQAPVVEEGFDEIHVIVCQ